MQETRGVAVLAESAPVARRDDGLGRLLRVVELPRTRRLFAQEAPVHATARRGHGSRAWHIALLGGSQLGHPHLTAFSVFNVWGGRVPHKSSSSRTVLWLDGWLVLSQFDPLSTVRRWRGACVLGFEGGSCPPGLRGVISVGRRWRSSDAARTTRAVDRRRCRTLGISGALSVERLRWLCPSIASSLTGAASVSAAG